MEKKHVAIGGALAVGVLVGALLMLSFAPYVNVFGNIGVEFEAGSIHTRIRMWKAGLLVFDEYHAGVVTDIGDNMTLAWLFGDSEYNVSQYLYNVTYISIGNQGTLSASSVVLPGEWNRTQGTIGDKNQSYLNVSCTFYPDNAGPYTADCIGLNWRSTASSTGNLWGYDTFTEVTGIDDSFTINIQIRVSVSHS